MNLNELQGKLENYENEINEAEKRKNQIEGKQESLLEKLKTEFQINNIDEIDEVIEKDKLKLEKLETEINDNLSELESYEME